MSCSCKEFGEDINHILHCSFKSNIELGFLFVNSMDFQNLMLKHCRVACYIRLAQKEGQLETQQYLFLWVIWYKRNRDAHSHEIYVTSTRRSFCCCFMSIL